jgi:hypothetical protein
MLPLTPSGDSMLCQWPTPERTSIFFTEASAPQLKKSQRRESFVFTRVIYAILPVENSLAVICRSCAIFLPSNHQERASALLIRWALRACYCAAESDVSFRALRQEKCSDESLGYG